MAKAILLLMGVGAYLFLLQYEYALATTYTHHIEKFYTDAGTTAATISASNR